MQNEIKVSVCCLTYNHEKFIRNAVEGFLMQKTDFPIEILIHDDASTDETADILREYQGKHPDLIEVIYQTENQYSQGEIVIDNLFNVAKGKYIALCEGDDYWTDPLKLQKQVDFLESHPEYAICFHNVTWIWEDNSRLPEIRHKHPRDTYTLADHILPDERATVGHTCSAVFRTYLIEDLPEWYFKALSGDIALFTFLGGFGLTKFINENMAIKRNHKDGISWTHNSPKIIKNKMNMYESIDKFYEYRYHQLIKPKIIAYSNLLIFHKELFSFVSYLQLLIRVTFNNPVQSNPIIKRLIKRIINKMDKLKLTTKNLL